MKFTRNIGYSIDSTSFIALVRPDIPRPKRLLDNYTDIANHFLELSASGSVVGWGCVIGDNEISLKRTEDVPSSSGAVPGGWLRVSADGLVLTGYDNLITFLSGASELPVKHSVDRYSDVVIEVPEGTYNVFIEYPSSSNQSAVAETDRDSTRQRVYLTSVYDGNHVEPPEWFVRAPRFD